MKHKNIISMKLDELKKDNNITAVLLMGSCANGSASEFSDLDLLILCDRNEFVTQIINDILVEMTYLTYDKAKYKLENYPMDVYHYFNSKILFDKHNQLTDLIEMAKRKYNLYCTPIDEKKQIKHWLMSASIKLKSANLSDDSLKVNYIVAMNSWKLIEAVWAVNNKPVPPAGSVSRFLGKLNDKPFDGWFYKLFSSDFQLRYDSYVKISNWAINNLEVLL